MNFTGLHLSAVEPGGGSPPPPAPAPAGNGAPPAPGSAGAPPAPSPAIDWNTAPAALRAQYETTKTELEPWKKLGKFEDVSSRHQMATAIHTEATEIGESLGYDANEIQEALSKDPVATLVLLRQRADDGARGNTPNPIDVKKLVEKQLEERLKPFNEREESRLNAEAESKFNGEVGRLFQSSFPNGLPDSCREALEGLAWLTLEGNPEAFKALREKGAMAGVQAAFDHAKKTLLKIVTDYMGHEKKRTGGGGNDNSGGNGGGDRKVTLDDIINSPEKINPRYAVR